MLPVSRAACEHAARLCAPPADNLRAGDALHLAVALDAEIKLLAGLDSGMNAAAIRLGFTLAL